EVLPPTIQKLMKGYNKYLRPFFGNGPVTVGMSLDIASIDTISEINMDYTATIFLRQRWTDERLCFDGNKSLSLDGRLVELLWVPDTFIVDSKKSFLHDITVENRLIRIFPNGTVLYALRITTTVACSMDLTKYPMDKQTCTLQLESCKSYMLFSHRQPSSFPVGLITNVVFTVKPRTHTQIRHSVVFHGIDFFLNRHVLLTGGYNVKDVVFCWTRGNQSVSGLDTLQLAQYTLEDYYTSESEAVYETGMYPKLIFHFQLRRSILYFILETYVPSSALVVLSWVSFWISQSSVPARICIGVTTVLTMTTLMMGARTSLPNANCFIKAIDVYLGICFSFIFGALIEYAVAHFCTLHQPNAANAYKYGQEMQEREDEMNGIVTSIGSHALRVRKREEMLSRAGSISSPTPSDTKEEKPSSQPQSRCTKSLSMLRRIVCFLNCCHVENPHYIDNYSRLTFPLSFIFINLLYWTYYLYF
ncbi:gamma-aminobutyric acid (GABA) A receptor, pi precursor, partial [Silurus meridionalis]